MMDGGREIRRKEEGWSEVSWAGSGPACEVPLVAVPRAGGAEEEWRSVRPAAGEMPLVVVSRARGVHPRSTTSPRGGGGYVMAFPL